MKRSSLASRQCSLARAGAALVDGWTLLIMREVMLGNCRFDGLERETGMSTRSLSNRLKMLEDEDILAKVPYQNRPIRHEYRLTEKGEALWPVIVVLKDWGEKWCGPWEDDEVPLRLIHAGHSHDIEPKIVCGACDEAVTLRSSIPLESKGLEGERSRLRSR